MGINIRDSNKIKTAKRGTRPTTKSGSAARVAFSLAVAIGLGSLYGVYLDSVQNEAQSNQQTPRFSLEGLEMPRIKEELLQGDEVIVPYEQADPINASLEEINSLNIIINDCDCRDDFINSVCEELDRDGIKFTFTKDSKGIDVDDSVVITLDQQYMAGPGTVVFAPLDNDRAGNSDALALAAKTAFYEKGFLVDGILCGQMGFRENADGTISERIPTSAEDMVSKDKNTSVVTVSFGTQNAHAGLAASAIEGTLTRYCSYLKSDYGNEDLIHCVESGEDFDSIAEEMGTSSISLNIYNPAPESSTILPGDALINPVVEQRREFDNLTPTNLYVDKTIWSK